MKLDVSIVIITYNRKVALRSCIDALLKQSYPRNKFEIIVVDNKSTDGTAQLLSKFDGRIKTYISPQNGYSTSRNVGVKNARANIIAFTDSDCLPDRDWVKNIVDSFKKSDGKIAAFGGPIKVHNNRGLIARVSQEIVNYSINRLKRDDSAYFLATTNLAVKRSVFKTIGYFDEMFDFETGEDTEYCWRIVKEGGELRYASKVRVEHIQRDNFFSFLRQHYKYGRGIYLVKKKHPDFMKAFRESNNLSRYFRELIIFPFIISDKFITPREKILALILTFLREIAFFSGIALARIKYR